MGRTEKPDKPEEHTDEDAMIEEIMRHLDTESAQGVVRMSVKVDETMEEEKQVSHKCCHMYGRPVNEVVGFLDMYSDSSMEKY